MLWHAPGEGGGARRTLKCPATLAAGALCRNSRLFELVLLLAGYVSVQGAWLINAMVDPSTTLFWHAVLLPVASIALVLAWPRLAGVRG